MYTEIKSIEEDWDKFFKKVGVAEKHHFLPLALVLARSRGSICSGVRPLTENRRLARSFRVPPHFSPRVRSSSFSWSRPAASRSSGEPAESRSKGVCTCWGGRTTVRPTPSQPVRRVTAKEDPGPYLWCGLRLLGFSRLRVLGYLGHGFRFRLV